MDTSSIPKAFWYSLSFCMVVGTLGLLVIAFRASSVSIEIADAKIELLSVVSQTKEIRATLEAESRRVAADSQRLQAQVAALEKSARISPNTFRIDDLIKGLQQTPNTAIESMQKIEFDALDAKIKSAEATLRK